MRLTKLLRLLALALALCSWPVYAQTRLLVRDLTFNFDCKDQQESSNVEDLLEEFLRNKGFDALNLGRVRRQHSVPGLDVYVLGMDKKSRIIRLVSFPQHHSYALSLVSPPPTEHDSQLENALLQFVPDRLGCKTREVTRNSNGVDAIQIYEKEVRRIENLFREVDDIGRGERL